mgnify:FL=1
MLLGACGWSYCASRSATKPATAAITASGWSLWGEWRQSASLTSSTSLAAETLVQENKGWGVGVRMGRGKVLDFDGPAAEIEMGLHGYVRLPLCIRRFEPACRVVADGAVRLLFKRRVSSRRRQTVPGEKGGLDDKFKDLRRKASNIFERVYNLGLSARP